MSKSFVTHLGEAIDRYRAQAPEQTPARHPGWLRWLGRQMMPNIGTLLLVVVLLLTVPSLAAPSRAPSATSTSTISYQGRLADSGGTPITGKQNMEFRLYDVPSGGAPLWIEMWTGGNAVDVSDGLFNVMLGSIDNTLDSTIQGYDELYLGITVGTDSEMSPRVQLGSVPFSMQALTVPDGTITSIKLANDAVTSSQIASGAVGSSEVADNSLTANDLAADSVGSSEVVNNSLTASDLAADSVGSSEVVNNSLTANDLAANSVGSSEVTNNSLTADDLAANSVGNSEIASGAVGTAKIADGAVTQAKLGDATLWRGLTNGSVVQKGSTWMNSGDTNTTIQFDQAFASGPLVIITQQEGSAGYANLIAHHVTASQFQVSKSSGTACGVNWIAIGRMP